MKIKKSLIIWFSIIVVLLTVTAFPATQPARATNTYARVITEDTPFFGNIEDQTPLFFLPYTYYVKILGEEQNFVHVECYGDGKTAALDGYVPKGYLFEDGLGVSSPYVVMSITTVDTAILYADAGLTDSLQYLFKDREMRYYGALPTGNGMVYFVDYNGKLGYVKESNVFPFAIPNHPNELTFITPEQPQPPPEKETLTAQSVFDFRFAIIACLIFAGLVALFLVISKNKPQKAVASFYDENDYE